MGVATNILILMFAINLVIFLLDVNGEVSAPLFRLLKGKSASEVINTVFLFGVAGTSVAALIGILVGGSFLSQGIMVIPVIIGLAIFTNLVFIPNFSAMGIPEPISTILQVFLGFLIILGIFGVFRGG